MEGTEVDDAIFCATHILSAMLTRCRALRRELVSQLVYREAGQIFQREGAAGEPPPLRRMIRAPTRAVTQEDLRTQESRKRLIRKVKLQSAFLQFPKRLGRLSLFTDLVTVRKVHSCFAL